MENVREGVILTQPNNDFIDEYMVPMGSFTETAAPSRQRARTTSAAEMCGPPGFQLVLTDFFLHQTSYLSVLRWSLLGLQQKEYEGVSSYNVIKKSLAK